MIVVVIHCNYSVENFSGRHLETLQNQESECGFKNEA